MQPSRVLAVVTIVLVVVAGGCESNSSGPDDGGPRVLDPELVAQGKEIFRFDTYGNETFWSDTARMHEVVATGVSPALALQVGLKVDADALPAAVKEAIIAGEVDLNDPATTIALLSLDAVVGLKGTVENGELTRLGITCALCHSTVDNSFAPGIGARKDGWPNLDLNVGAIVALSPAIQEPLKSIMNSWGPGMYDPRINIDGQNTPLVIPPAYGLNGVEMETYTADGPVSYWNAYVAITQMHGHGDFEDARLGISVDHAADLVTSKLPALLEYQLSLEPPPPPPGSFDPAAAARGEVVFDQVAECSFCHIPERQFTDVNLDRLHAPSATGMDPAYAQRTATKLYRTTPLRGLWQHAPYFHDGSAATLEEVVEHYDSTLNLGLTAQQKADLVQYLRTL